MKARFKEILPQPVKNALRGARDRVKLTVVSSQNFSAQNLRSAPIECDSIWSDFGAAWERDSAMISAVLGHDNRAGGVNPGDRQALYKMVTALSPSRVLEIGTHIGASSLYIAAALKAAGKGGRVTTVDIADVNAPEGPWKQAGLPAAPRGNAEALGLAGLIDFVTQGAQAYMRSVEARYDLIFLDGAHDAQSVYSEMAVALSLLAPNGLVLLHDYYPAGRPLFPDSQVISGPFMALRRIMCEAPEITVQPLGALPWETKQGSHNTSLALVLKETP